MRQSRPRRGTARVAGAAATLIAGAVAVLLVLTVPVLTNAYLRLLPFTAAGPGTAFHVPSGSKAADAAASGTTDDPATRAAAYLATQPEAVWLTPEAQPVDTVGAHVTALAAEARSQDATLVLVVYGLPDRDCGNQSAGGLDPAAYDTWTRAIGAAVRAAETPTVVIVEPDAVALAPDCDGMTERFAHIATAVTNLQARTAWLYLDGGHSNWRPASEMARLIERIGVTHMIRGVATNVSNYNTDAAEVMYARTLSAALGGLHAVIDTSRNGAGATGEWCNPAGRLVGARSGSFGDDIVDANLWIKPPGESDGACNGGPAAGRWWPESAVELTRDVG
ncbi:glycoside hydrolase family 6 protein [uncultured Microbacterium sp.]|uniref:Glucanase n=1 Tax=uncultured Microbacterium sp. TaxID=191216 RepID=A0A1Y5P4C6_9MICO|nr:glycoside hydrolase family 6 protein [uncultured Microbacterium sp.]SBS73497.1 1, 4-beta cellobiohydrolase [uncultured Microbacterium sp.]